MNERLNQGCNMGVTDLAEIFTSGSKCAKNNWRDLVSEFFFQKKEILVKNRPKSSKMEFFDLDFSGTKNGQGKKFQEHLW